MQRTGPEESDFEKTPEHTETVTATRHKTWCRILS